MIISSYLRNEAAQKMFTTDIYYICGYKLLIYIILKNPKYKGSIPIEVNTLIQIGFQKEHDDQCSNIFHFQWKPTYNF